jgi:uncharacterized membrane protein
LLRAELEEVLEPVVESSQRQGIIQRVTEVFQAEIFKGPIAHPKHLAEYERTCPGLADRITKMAEFRQQKSEDRLDTIVRLEYEDRRRGMYLGFSSLIVLLVCGTLISLFGNIWVGGSLLAAATLGAVIAPFIDGRAQKPFSQLVRRGKTSPPTRRDDARQPDA